MRRCSWLALLLVCIALSPASAKSTERSTGTATGTATGTVTDSDAGAKAREHLGKGNVHYDLQEYRKALIEFREAYRLKSDPALLFNMGQCNRKLSHYREAIDFYKTYLRKMPSASNRAEVERLIAESEQSMKEAKPEAAAAPDAGATPAKALSPNATLPLELDASVPALPDSPAADAPSKAGGPHHPRRRRARAAGQGDAAAPEITQAPK